PGPGPGHRARAGRRGAELAVGDPDRPRAPGPRFQRGRDRHPRRPGLAGADAEAGRGRQLPARPTGLRWQRAGEDAGGRHARPAHRDQLQRLEEEPGVRRGHLPLRPGQGRGRRRRRLTGQASRSDGRFVRPSSFPWGKPGFRREPGPRTGNPMRRLPLLLIMLLTAAALPAAATRALEVAPATPPPATAAGETINGAVAGVLIAALSEQFGGRSVSIMLDEVSVQQASIRDSTVSGQGRARIGGDQDWIGFRFSTLYDTAFNSAAY